MIASVYIIVFEMVLAIYAENKMKPEELNDLILSERPLFDFEISQNDISGKTNITFFEYSSWHLFILILFLKVSVNPISLLVLLLS